MTRNLAINTYGYIWSTPAADCVRRLAELNYQHFELVIHPPHLPLDGLGRSARRELRSAVERAEAKISALNLPSLDHNLASPFARVRKASVAMFTDVIDLASDLGAEWLVIVPGRMSPLFPPTPADRTQWVTESAAELLRSAEARGVGLAIENVPFAAFPDAISLGQFVRSFGSPLIGVCYDAANAHFIGESPAEGLTCLADLLRIVHLSDTTREVWRHDPIGAGKVPFGEVARTLNDVAFQGYCTLEIIDADPETAILQRHRALTPFGFSPCPVEPAA